MTRSLSILRPTLKGVRLSTMFFCSLPCTSTSPGNTPDADDCGRPIAFKTMRCGDAPCPRLHGNTPNKNNLRNYAPPGELSSRLPVALPTRSEEHTSELQ